VGTIITTLCGLLLLNRLGEPWIHASYDYLFRFLSRPVTNDIVVVQMDAAARNHLAVSPDAPYWPRELHAQLLNKLAEDGSPLVVMDVLFKTEGSSPQADNALEASLKRLSNVVLVARGTKLAQPGSEAAEILLPWPRFLQAAGENHWGLDGIDPDPSGRVRKHWPFPINLDYPGLAYTAARLVGAALPPDGAEPWLRYYANNGGWSKLSYHVALQKPPGWFAGKTVFIGKQPDTTSPKDHEEDEFSTPYTRWTDESVGGVQIQVTQFLNLVNNDWLRRLHPILEGGLVVLVGAILGFGLPGLRLGWAALLTVVAFVTVSVGALVLTHLTNYWFPWLVVVGGQLPCAWFCSLPRRPRAVPATALGDTVVAVGDTQPYVEIPYTPDYQRVCKLGQGGFGEVWLVRNAIGQWQALKVVYREKFDEDRHYNYEFDGITKYKPVSEKHQGLLRIELISQKRSEGYYYYIMELGDSRVPGWEREPLLYKPKDLETMRPSGKRRLPPKECVQIISALADALHFLHQQGLTHRDIKPSNVIFVHGQPKLADVGLVTQVRLPDKTTTQVGTPGYMPPAPEPQGTVQADIYALGMVLYVISTGAKPQLFPELSKTLFDQSSSPEFLRLNPVILKACHPDRAQRYKTAAEFHDDLLAAMSQLNPPQTGDSATS